MNVDRYLKKKQKLIQNVINFIFIFNFKQWTIILYCSLRVIVFIFGELNGKLIESYTSFHFGQNEFVRKTDIQYKENRHSCA